MSRRVPANGPAPGEVLAAISDGIVALLKEYYGKGPTEAKTYYQDDLVVCLLRGGLTRVEKTLYEGGRLEAVTQQRMAFQEVMRNCFEAVVEQATGRRVIGFMSGYQQEPDMICEVFILAGVRDDPGLRVREKPDDPAPPESSLAAPKARYTAARPSATQEESPQSTRGNSLMITSRREAGHYQPSAREPARAS